MKSGPTRVNMTADRASALVAGRAWWYHTFEIFPGVVTPGVYEPSGMLAQLGLPNDLRGQRILEIGPADGYFTKQLAMRGGQVTAYDYAAKDHYGFAVMEELHGTPFEFVQGTIYEIDRFNFAPFDIVLCMGVLYHLPDMIRAVHLLRKICKTQLIVETVVGLDLGDEPTARYFPAASFNNDFTNFWAPNMACVQAMLTDVGFEVVTSKLLGAGAPTPNTGRAIFHCRRSNATDATKKTDVAYTHLTNSNHPLPTVMPEPVQLHEKSASDILALFEDRDRVSNKDFPIWPPHDIQMQFTGGAGMHLLERSLAFLEQMTVDGAFVNPDWRGLDYGCGWGRLASTMLVKGSASQLDLCDAWPEALGFIRANGFRNKHWQVSESLAESDLPSDAYDLIYAFSIFTHLNKEAFENNVRRIVNALHPGGNFYFTVRHPDFVESMKSAYKFTNAQVQSAGAANDGFLHIGYQGKAHYGETIVAPTYLQDLASNLGVLDYIGLKEAHQHVYRLRKTGGHEGAKSA